MGANACTFVFSEYITKRMYFVLDKGIARNDKVFLISLFDKPEVVKGL